MLIEHTATVAALFDKLNPDVDPMRLRSSARRYETLAQSLSELQVPLDGAARVIADAFDGHTSDAASGRARAVADGELTTALTRLQTTADMVRAYADAVTATQQRLTVVAAIADRDLLAAQVVVVATGDTTAQTEAEQSAARVMTATAGELDTRARQIADDATDQTASDAGADSTGTGTPMVPAAMISPMAATLGGLAAHRAGRGSTFEAEPAAAELLMLRGRAATLAATVPPEVAPWVRLAVGLGRSGDGRRVVVIGTSEPGGYLRPGVVPEPHEVVVGDGRAPELAIIGYFADRDVIPLAVCAATPAPPDVSALVTGSGAATVDVVDDDSSPGTQQ